VLVAWVLVVVAACQRHDAPLEQAPRQPASRRDGSDGDTCDPSKPKICLGDDVVACEPDGHLGRRLRACHKVRNGKCQNVRDMYEAHLPRRHRERLHELRSAALPGNPIKVISKPGTDTSAAVLDVG
jgi:hypothetical protein